MGKKKVQIGIRFVADQYWLEVEGVSKNVIEIQGPTLLDILESAKYKFGKKTMEKIEYEISLIVDRQDT